MSIRVLATPYEHVNAIIEYVNGEVCRLVPHACARLINLMFQRNLINQIFKKDPHIRTVRSRHNSYWTIIFVSMQQLTVRTTGPCSSQKKSRV